MKATGIVRRIDDLGRIVVPKEIRRTLRIREGDPLEIFTDREGEIILKKYSPIGELGQFAGEYAESLAQTTGYLVLVTDCDHVIAASGSGKKEFEEKPVSRQLEEAISERKNYQASAGDAEFMKVTLDDAGEYTEQAFSTIICEGDAIGAVIICNKDEKKKMNDTEGKLAAAAASFLEILKECWYRQQQDFWDGRWNSKINSEMRRGGKIKKAKIFPLLIYYWKNKKNHIQ